MVESNMGHIGDDIDPKGGDDPTLYGWRAAAESAPVLQARGRAGLRVGTPPLLRVGRQRRRSPLTAVLENAPDVFDGALPFMGGGDVRPFPATDASRAPRS